MAVFLFLFCLILMLIWSAPIIMLIIKLLLSLLCVLWCDWNNELNCFQKCHTSHPCCESLQRHDKWPYKYRLNPFSIKCLEQTSRCFRGYSFKWFFLEWKDSYFEAVSGAYNGLAPHLRRGITCTNDEPVYRLTYESPCSISRVCYDIVWQRFAKAFLLKSNDNFVLQQPFISLPENRPCMTSDSKLNSASRIYYFLAFPLLTLGRLNLVDAWQ